MPVKPPKKLKLSRAQLGALQKRIKQRKLKDDDWQVLHALTETADFLSQAIEEKNAAIGRLCKYLFGAPTETAKNVIKKDRTDEKPEKPKTPKKSKGHGRKPAAAYQGGTRVTLEHPQLEPGNRCPECDKGRVYELALPAVSVYIQGEAPLKSTVYERLRLRCNLCGEIYTPELPAEVADKKYDESAAALIAVLKYGCGMPFNRIAKLQADLKNPVPSSTQWDIVNAAALPLAPVHDAMIGFAAQGELIHNDDTTMKVLDYLKEQDPENGRKGIFTTGMVSKWQDHQIALFMTGRNHAGENLNDLLKRRATGLSPPIQMCDALTRNKSEDFETIMANCLAHARRQFVEIVNSFPEECAYMIDSLATVYHHDAIARQQEMTAQQRLDYHNQHSGPIMAELESWCNEQISKKLVEPNSGLGKAINYMRKRWKNLTRFLQIPGAPLDNNLCERALKYAICHRKNALFYKTQRGANVGDLFMSLIHTCQLAGVNPLDYISWLLKNAQNLAKSPEQYMPWNFNQLQPQS